MWGDKTKTNMKNTLLKIKILFTHYFFYIDYEGWKEAIWDRDLDELDCCNGRECGCEGRTIKQNYSK